MKFKEGLLGSFCLKTFLVISNKHVVKRKLGLKMTLFTTYISRRIKGFESLTFLPFFELLTKDLSLRGTNTCLKLSPEVITSIFWSKSPRELWPVC